MSTININGKRIEVEYQKGNKKHFFSTKECEHVSILNKEGKQTKKYKEAMENNYKHMKIGTNKILVQKDHDVSITLECDCRFQALHGCTKGQVCSHIQASLQKFLEEIK